MRPLVILCRHGNTFERGQKVVMVGAKEDLTLTNEGREQAHRIADAFRATQLKPARMLCGPLQRTFESTEIILAALALDLKPLVDERLRELDYGAWGGLSQDEISERFGLTELLDWQERGVRPTSTSFAPSEDALRSETVALLKEFETYDGISLVITSNGRLREFARVVASASTKYDKVKTGHACVIAYEGDRWRILAWDNSPEQLVTALGAYVAI
jgi:probable phosphoglycerate mutase